MKILIPIIIGLLWTVPTASLAARAAISDHYVQRALDQAATIADRHSGEVGNTLGWYLFKHWMPQETQSCSVTLRDLIDIEVQSDIFAEQSTCLHHDANLLEQKIIDNCTLMKSRLGDGALSHFISLKFANAFLLERYKFLMLNALKPDVVDETWVRKNPDGTEEPPICAFHSTYQDPYELVVTDKDKKEKRVLIGCSNTALQAVQPADSIITDAIDTYRTIYNTRKDLLPDYQQNLLQEEQIFHGCRPDVSTSTGTIAIVDEETQDWSYVALSPKHNPFLVLPDPITLLTNFYTTRFKWGLQRAIPDYLQAAPSTSSGNSVTKGVWFVWDYFAQPSRERMLSISASQAVHDIPVIEGVVTPLQGDDTVIESLQSLQKLTTNSNDGLRKFVINFASYLQRTCIDRPCQNRLEYILKAAFTDDCFPYSEAGDDANEALKSCLDAIK